MAASGSAVTVLTPNGRRQTIKVAPNTPLLQVLEDVCKKHGFDPNDHGLKFQRTVLDLTLPWRFANLPNNAKLEMVTSTRKQSGADSQVRIALQMEDGSRLQGSFSSGQSLWEVIAHFPVISDRVSELTESGATPACVYMRDEVSGEEALKKTTLKSLGLTGGSAIVRFLHKKNQAAAEEDGPPSTPVAMETAPSESPQPDPAPSIPEASAEVVPTSESDPHEPSQTPAAPAAPAPSSVAEDVPKPQDVVRPKVQRAVEDGQEAGPSGLNSLPAASAPAAAFIPFSGGGQRLGGLAGEIGHSLSSSSSSSLAALTPTVQSPKAKKAKSNHSTKCKATVKSADRDLDNTEEFLEPVDREPLIYHMDSVSRRSEAHADLPDEFFEVTVDDVRKRFAQLKSERKLLEEAPLLTKALREAQMKEKMERYPKVVLRIQFPDRHVLQGFFRPLETVGAVRHFLRSHLEDPEISFYLFITPPKTILKDPSATLVEADLFPGALVYFGSDVKAEFYIKRDLLETSVSALQANESIASCLLQSPETTPGSEPVEEPPPPAEAMDTDPKSAREEPEASTQAHGAKPVRAEPGKVPKWFKLPGKK
ncbi:PREDICTED: tether containing UBX domain for GLUT4 isoform X2 [Poecilia mexicana]|uniref:tether containing UBX domain for GLUT4 isoform X2 n=1 Tax=Poecilia mexicana TaxID=48701 RepID=UPI00072E14C9|nr:PREDICTED: tether containing UBX domain for GLUT4 isoform X2 [Poecilia mexicana]